MENIGAKDLHTAVKFLKELRVKIIDDLPHYGNYGLFFKNDAITTGLMNNKMEIQINLITGNFHFYDTEYGWTYALTKNDAPEVIMDYLKSKKINIQELHLDTVPISQMLNYHAFAIKANLYLDQLRLRLKGQYTQVYLWGHNFDFDLVWYTGDESSQGYDEQIDVGVAPGDINHPESYLYVTPRPFKDKIVSNELPIGKWVTDSWKGILVKWQDILDMGLKEGVDMLEKLYNIGKINFK